MEDLKARYYTIARQLLIAREGGPEQVAAHTLVKHPFNAATEKWVPVVHLHPAGRFIILLYHTCSTGDQHGLIASYPCCHFGLPAELPECLQFTGLMQFPNGPAACSFYAVTNRFAQVLCTASAADGSIFSNCDMTGRHAVPKCAIQDLSKRQATSNSEDRTAWDGTQEGDKIQV